MTNHFPAHLLALVHEKPVLPFFASHVYTYKFDATLLYPACCGAQCGIDSYITTKKTTVCGNYHHRTELCNVTLGFVLSLTPKKLSSVCFNISTPLPTVQQNIDHNHCSVLAIAIGKKDFTLRPSIKGNRSMSGQNRHRTVKDLVSRTIGGIMCQLFKAAFVNTLEVGQYN